MKKIRTTLKQKEKAVTPECRHTCMTKDQPQWDPVKALRESEVTISWETLLDIAPKIGTQVNKALIRDRVPKNNRSPVSSTANNTTANAAASNQQARMKNFYTTGTVNHQQLKAAQGFRLHVLLRSCGLRSLRQPHTRRLSSKRPPSNNQYLHYPVRACLTR